MLRYVSYDDNHVYLVHEYPWRIQRAPGNLDDLDSAICRSLNQNGLQRLPFDTDGLESYVIQDLINEGVEIKDMPEREWLSFIHNFAEDYLTEAESKLGLREFLEHHEGNPHPRVPENNQSISLGLRAYLLEQGKKQDIIDGETFNDIILPTRISELYSKGYEFRTFRERKDHNDIRSNLSARVELAILGDKLQLICIGVSGAKTTNSAKLSSRKTNKRLRAVARFFAHNYGVDPIVTGAYIRYNPAMQWRRADFSYSQQDHKLIRISDSPWEPIDL